MRDAKACPLAKSAFGRQIIPFACLCTIMSSSKPNKGRKRRGTQTSIDHQHAQQPQSESKSISSNSLGDTTRPCNICMAMLTCLTLTLWAHSVPSYTALNPGEQHSQVPTHASSRTSARVSKRAKTVAAPEDTRDSAIAVETSTSGNDSRYNTRAINRTRRPALDTGLDWRDKQREREDAVAARSKKKADTKRQNELKAHEAEQHTLGIKQIAALEAERELEDAEDSRQLQARTAHGYRMASLASRGRGAGPALDLESGGSGSEFQAEDGRNDQFEEEFSSMDEVDESDKPTRKVCTCTSY